MIRLGGWCARRPGGAAVPIGRPWACPGPADRTGRAGCRSLRVLVDMDGVLADFEGGFLRKFRARFPDQPFIALEDRRGFWVSEQYGRLRPGLSEKAISIWESKNFFFELEPLPGAVEAVKQMASLQNTDVFICTSPIKMFKYCPYEKTESHYVTLGRVWWCHSSQQSPTLGLKRFSCLSLPSGWDDRCSPGMAGFSLFPQLY
ncbi:5'(3')-deoxyribonucleotidase, mitochondrial isoform X3 [Nycticebus coucang]|uniref:5'(3')-deoxyribonucleotidase, mitochondrial isoform X3 n=1 Tax=Nycticebus coucang TaxID=9470 RepID=UPI00234D4630|nr:5'(3')-deoxyribonucleotidase, mitochondrial isoform X3 [Nycticebus coucang]